MVQATNPKHSSLSIKFSLIVIPDKDMKEISPITQLLHMNTFHAFSRSLAKNKTFLTGSQGKDLDLCVFIYFSTSSLLWSHRVQHSQRKTRNFFHHKFKHRPQNSKELFITSFHQRKSILDLNFCTLLKAICSSF